LIGESPPEPLVPADVDLSKLAGFMLDTRRLLGSELVAISSGEEFKAAVLLWCRAWQQPRCSLPDDDRILASFAGVPLARWPKVREVAMHGFVKCSDGRWYHRVLSTDAVRADRMAKQRRKAIRERWERDRSNADRSTSDHTEPIRPYKSRSSKDLPLTGHDSVPNGTEYSEAKASAVPAQVDPVKALFDAGVSVLTAARIPEPQARSLVGKWRKELHDDSALMALLADAAEHHAIAPVAYITAAVQRHAEERANPHGRAWA
jgi:uncharacterized protein YdaU (DUF1376 family)